MKNGFAISQDVDYNSPANLTHNNHHLNNFHQNDNRVDEEQVDGESRYSNKSAQILINGSSTSAGDNTEGLFARKSSSAAMDNPLLFPPPSSSPSSAKFSRNKDAYSAYEVLWCRTKSWIESLKHVPWKNNRALPGRAYTPTEVSCGISIVGCLPV